MKVICQICQESIAGAELEVLAYPMKGSMFSSVDTLHDYPPPFGQDDNWETMRCPHGRIQGESGQIGGHRPFIKDDEILTDQGIYRIPHNGQTPEPPSDEEAERIVREKLGAKAPVSCPVCGKAFDTNRKLQGHMIAHKRKKAT